MATPHPFSDRSTKGPLGKGKRAAAISFEMPESLQHGDDLDIDVTAPKSDDPRFQHRSFFDLITNAGSLIELKSRLTHDELSESEEETEAKAAEPSSSTPSDAADESRKPEERTKHRRGLSDNKLMRSIFKPRLKSLKQRQDIPAADMMSSSQILPGKPEVEGEGRAETASTPDLRRMFLDEATKEASALGSDLRKAHETFGASASPPSSKGIESLAQRVMRVFQLEEEEEVVADFPCYLVQSVMLQGTLYITRKHICFYAYLPKKSHEVIKSGYLSKRGLSKWNRRWFILKGDVLAYYNDRTNTYFPRGRINLRYGISAEMVQARDKSKDVLDFTVRTNDNTYQLRADSMASAKEWVKSLQKAIFKAHNDGESVKILLPIDKILDVEENTMMEHTKVISIRLMDNDNSYAIDDYYFSCFGFGKEAMKVMQTMVEDSKSKRLLEADQLASFSMGQDGNDSEGERMPLSHGFDGPPDASGSATFSLEHDTASSAAIQSVDDTEVSASQILSRSDVFHRPSAGLTNLASSESSVGIYGRDSQETARSGELTSHDGTRQVRKFENTTSARGSRTPIQESKDLEDENEMRSDKMQASGSTFGLKGLVSAGTYPIQKASGLAGFLQSRSKQVNNILASTSMSYYEKVSGMWAGGKKHYTTEPGSLPDDQLHEAVDGQEARVDNERFQEHFALPATEKLRAAYICSITRVIPLRGKIYLSDKWFCYRSLIYGTKTKVVIPLQNIENVDKKRGFTMGRYGLVIAIRGYEELFFEFSKADERDDCNVTLHQMLESIQYLHSSGLLSQENVLEAEAAKAEHELLQQAHEDGTAKRELKLPKNITELGPSMIFDDMSASIVEFKPSKPLHFTCLTVGSRGDVQPYIALCKRLMQDGHKTRIVSHGEFGDWVKNNGIEFRAIGGDPAVLMNLCVEHGMFTPSFLYETITNFMPWLNDLLNGSWDACQGTDVLIESPSAMAGIHIAEALEIPYFRAFTMPWTRTRAYPHSFAVPKHKMGGTYNFLSYVLFEEAWWKTISLPLNWWRRQKLGLGVTNLKKMQINKIPFLYNFSPSVVPPPLDYSDWTHVTGYWFLDEGDNFKPPTDLANFIAKARKDGKKLVYIGFGSIPLQEDPRTVTKTIIDAVDKADVRCIFSKGWSDRGPKEKGGPKEAAEEGEDTGEIPLPPEIFRIQACPHDWLFKQVDAVAHHGGSGTTGASLRAGVPTIIKPFFGDQFFFAQRVKDLGVGIHISKLNTTSLGRALWQASHDERMRTRARQLGEKIRLDTGIENAVNALYRDMDYAKSLIKRRGTGPQDDLADEDDEPDENWTFVEREDEPELIRRLSEMEPTAVNTQTDWQQLKQLQEGGQNCEEDSKMLESLVLKHEGTSRRSASP